ncbi:RAB GDP/GTP exchange factor, putative [Entamoeba dispar SAW760]|uniref:RAB GDP/GTP exchange factor, putative n=1 Tax=Entamoeba dispar (strain ATCC PRA-260 / SAW760) TaxID=370354 RepID=B0EBA1_ENTDS|nr:RAB GDP/GTP exchange factor, putative [Entamoeba dispar SAW760]EDR28190.1 RAB GDP/GTP exchange factor, putative [Entamoeba dispar SAW760]|eukprot:EDR28190.1 RAB GDP/GTP exchange factor, putative [Entamoeba dispar SAW760]
MKTTRTYGHRSVVSEQICGTNGKSSPKKFIHEQNNTSLKQLGLNFEPLVSTFISMHGGVCLESTRLHNSIFINNSPIICDMLSSDVGRYAVLCALQFSLTLCLPHDTISIPTPEFIVSHLIRRHPKSKAFMALNGTVGILKNEVIKYKKNSLKLWKCQYDLMHEFLTKESHVQEEETDFCVNVLGGDILHTPVGAIPILVIDEPFRWEGCSWGWGWDTVDSWKVTRVEFIDNNIDQLLGSDFPNLRYIEQKKKEEELKETSPCVLQEEIKIEKTQENSDEIKPGNKEEQRQESIDIKQEFIGQNEKDIVEQESTKNGSDQEHESPSDEDTFSQFTVSDNKTLKKKTIIISKNEKDPNQRSEVISMRRQTISGIIETTKSPNDTSLIGRSKTFKELRNSKTISIKIEPSKTEIKDDKISISEDYKIPKYLQKNEMDKGLKDGYEVFKTFLTFSCNITIQDYILVSIKRFPNLVKGMGLKERAEVMYDLMQGVMDRTNNSPIRLDGLYRKMFIKHLWEVFTTSLFNFLWPPIIERNEGDVVFECNQRDSELNTIISTHQFVAPHHFDLGFLENDLGKRGIDLISKELRLINSYCSPRNKSYQIYNCFKLATEVVGRLQSTAVSADLLLPTIIYCIIYSSPLNLVSTIEYLTNFTPKWAGLPSEVSYYIAHMHSAVSFLMRFSQRSLTISPNDYSLFLYYSKRRVNPFIRPKSILLKENITWNIDKKEGESEVNAILFNVSTTDLDEDDAPVLLTCYAQLLSDNKVLLKNL